MEWRQQTSLSCADAFNEAQRWIEVVTGKTFDCRDFRAALENGVLLCDLINQLKPGIIKRVNRLSTPIAGLDNVSVFLKACGKLGLNESQLFHPGDLQDLSTRVTLKRDESNRRLKNVLITIYWLGRKANQDLFYQGPQLNFKSFEGLLGLALSRALDDASNCCYYKEKDEIQGRKLSYKRQSSVDSVESLDAKGATTNGEEHAFISEETQKEGTGPSATASENEERLSCGSDAEAEQVFKIETTHTSAQSNKGYLPPPLQKAKQARGEHGIGCTSPLSRPGQIQINPERPVQVNPGWIWSKSLSDIPMVYPVRKVSDEKSIMDATQDMGARYDMKRKCSTAKDTEAQWQDDLTKWKSRRRSSRSEVQRKSLDREHVITQMTNGAATMTKGGPVKRDQPSQHSHNPATHPYSTSLTKFSRSNLRPHTRALLARSYATETPFNSPTSYSSHASVHLQGVLAGDMPVSESNILGKEDHMATLASVGVAATTPSMENPFSSQTHIKNSPVPIPPMSGDILTTHGSSDLPKEIAKLNVATENLTVVNHTTVNINDDSSNQKVQKENQDSSEEPNREQGPGKYLCRAGTWSGSSSLPRGYRRSEGASRLSSVITARPFGTKPSRVSSLPRLCNGDDFQLNSMSHNEKEASVSPPITILLKRQTAMAHLKGHPPVMQTEHRAAQEKENCAMPSNVPQTNDHHQLPHLQILPRPELCTAQVSQHNSSSSVLKEPNVPAHVDHSDMRVCLTLKPNSRQDFGFQTHWDNKRARVKSIQPGTSAELLCVSDEIIAVDGVTVTQMNYSQWKNKMTSALQTGSLTMDVRRYGKSDWSTTEQSLYKQPGQNMMTLDLTSAAPVLIGRPDPHANSDTTVMTMSKFNGQTNNVNVCQSMDGEHTNNPRTARNKGGSESAISDLQVPSLSPGSSSWSWDHEEERRRQEKWQEEQERLLQEKYQRDQERLEAEWQKAQQDASSDIGKKDELKLMTCEAGQQMLELHINGTMTKTQDVSSTPNEVKKKENYPCEAIETPNEKSSEDWLKSLSTPTLASPQKQMRVVGEQRKRKGQTVSKVEQERQQILEEMKKRTQLLTDNSWIRQRSASFYKEPLMPGVPIKRYESMDNLESWRHSPVAAVTLTYPRPQSAAAGYCGSTRISSSRHSTGSMPPQRSTAGRMEPGRRTCCVCEGVLDSGAAMVVEALSLCFHLTCFQCMGCHQDLRGTETGVQVRIQNHRPYCEPCYFQLKSACSATM